MQILNNFLTPFYKDIKSLILDTLFPVYCLSCETEGPKFICDDCAGKFTLLPHQFCIVCQKMSIGGLTHPKCLRPYTADGLICIYDYMDEKVSNLLIKGKYSFLPDVYKEIGAIIANAVKTNFPHLLRPQPLALCCVPLHWMRQNWRGFNQSQILAKALAEHLDLPFSDALIRKKFTRTQKNLKKPERIKNLENAFALSASSPLEGERGVRGNNFILIDDVTTTGQTLSEAAKVLKRNGAQKVWCLTVARD